MHTSERAAGQIGTTVSGAVSFAVTWLQRAAIAVALVALFQGRGAQGTFLGLALAIPVVRWLVSPRYRRHVAEAIRRSWDELVAFASAPSRAIPWRAAALFAAAPLACLTLANGSLHSSHDNYGTILTAVSLVRDGSPEISRLIPQQPGQLPQQICGKIETYYSVCVGDRIYSAYPAGLLVVAVPVFALARLLGGSYDDPLTMSRLEKLAAVAVAAACAVLFFLIVLLYLPPAAALVLATHFALGSAVFSTVAGGLWTNGGVLLGFLGVLWIELLHEKRGSRPGTAALWLQAVLLACMLATRLTSALIIAPFGLWVLARDWRRGLRLALMSAVCLAPWVLYYQLLYGNPLGPQMYQKSGWSTVQHRWLDGLAAVLFSPGRGVFVYQPWALLAVPGLFWWRRKADGLALFCAVAIALHASLIAGWWAWDGGWCWGSRLMTEVLPLFGLLAIPAVGSLWRKRAGRIALLALLPVALYLHAAHFYLAANLWMGLKPEGMSWMERHWQWRETPFLFPLQRHSLDSRR